MFPSGITRPTLLLDETKCRANIARMAGKAQASATVLRPHFKTHQSAGVAAFFRDAGITCCTVSSVTMAGYFVRHGWLDITIAFPLNPREAPAINALAAKARLAVCAVNAEALEQAAPHLTHPVYVWIELDTGYHRTGVDPENHAAIQSIINTIQRHRCYTWAGFLDHAGHTYACRGAEQVRTMAQHALQQLVQTGAHYRAVNPRLKLSTGDTPGCSTANRFSGVDEVRPGNFAFYDLTQEAIGSCTREQIAIALACPVVAVYPHRQEVVVQGGSVHLSKDALLQNSFTTFGQPVALTGEGWQFSFSGSYVKSLSQEHGIIHLPARHSAHVQVGDVIGIVPVHACLAADAMRQLVTRDEKVFELMPK